MKAILTRLPALLCALCLLLPFAGAARSPVPDAMPADLGGKTPFGYLTELRKNYLPAKVFTDPERYSDADRENARRAARLIVEETTAAMEAEGKAHDSYLFLRGWALEQLYLDSGEEDFKTRGLADYELGISLGGKYMQPDYERLAAREATAGPLVWQLHQMLSADEMEEALGLSENSLTLADSLYRREDASRLAAAYVPAGGDDPEGSAILVIAEPRRGKGGFKAAVRHAFLREPVPVDGLGDEAVLIGMRNLQNDPRLYTAAVVRRDELVLQVRVPDLAWRSRGADPGAMALAAAGRFLENLYDRARPLPPAEPLPAPLLPVKALPEGREDPAVPDGLPEDLGGKTVYGFIVDQRKEFLPAGVFTDGRYTKEERNRARLAIRLLVGLIGDIFDESGPDPYQLEIRGACYALAWEDSQDPVFRQLAVNDYRKAMSGTVAYMKADYGRLATPLLGGMVWLSQGDSGEAVRRLQRWLILSGHLSGPESGSFDEATARAVAGFRASAGLKPEGGADLACVLALYARVDDGDEPLPGL